MLQRLPGTTPDHDAWQHATVLFDTLGAGQLRNTPVNTLLYRLYQEDGVRVLDTRPLRLPSSCSSERVADVLVCLVASDAMASPQAEGLAELPERNSVVAGARVYDRGDPGCC